MKKILLAITLFMFSCNTSNNTNIIPKSIPTPSPNLTSSIIENNANNQESNIKKDYITFTTSKGEIINCGTLEENIKDLSIKCPTNVAANKDFVYFTSYVITTTDTYQSKPLDCNKRNLHPLSKTEENKSFLSFIYKIDNNKKIDVIRDFNNKPIYNECNSFYHEIQTNSNNELYFNVNKYFNGYINEIIKQPPSNNESGHRFNTEFKVINNDIYL